MRTAPIVLVALLAACSPEPRAIAVPPNNDVRPGSSMAPPARRWVLRDSAGTYVDAEVSPGPRAFDPEGPREFEYELDPKCFVPTSIAKTFLAGVIYSLEEGTMDACVPFVDDVDTYYEDAGCQGHPMLATAPTTVMRESGIKSTFGGPDVVGPQQLFIKSGGACRGVAISAKGRLWKLEDTPSDIQARFPDAPYTLTWE